MILRPIFSSRKTKKKKEKVEKLVEMIKEIDYLTKIVAELN